MKGNELFVLCQAHFIEYSSPSSTVFSIRKNLKRDLRSYNIYARRANRKYV